MSEAQQRFGWGHVNINVRDLDRSIEFYRKLGFEIFIPAIPYLNLDVDADSKPIPDGGALALGVGAGSRGRACIMQLDDGFPKLDLTEFEHQQQSGPLRNADVGLVRICLVSRDLSRDVAELREQGVEFVSEPGQGHNGMADIAVCMDPDGTLIELLEVHLERWPALPSGT